jgi:predicted Zn-dependent protease
MQSGRGHCAGTRYGNHDARIMNRRDRRRLGSTLVPAIAEIDAAFELHRAGNLSAAERRYRKLIREDPDNCDALRLHGELLVDRRQYDDAIITLSRTMIFTSA